MTIKSDASEPGDHQALDPAGRQERNGLSAQSEESAMFIVRILIASALIAVSVMPTPTEAAQNSDSRQSIKSMPITARPSRPGHFYGNTVRRVHQRRSG
jgi:hypothetical protein